MVVPHIFQSRHPFDSRTHATCSTFQPNDSRPTAKPGSHILLWPNPIVAPSNMSCTDVSDNLRCFIEEIGKKQKISLLPKAL
jgi:hypothetical protein